MPPPGPYYKGTVTVFKCDYNDSENSVGNNDDAVCNLDNHGNVSNGNNYITTQANYIDHTLDSLHQPYERTW